ncbi:MAG: hypothetical protein JRI92_06060, partial [Deltaproteobacteria bacterium]|nr:hypothetical protein [Deltaproteobacteria bacterium]
PILFAGGDTDLFGYCLNDPVNAIDPYGLFIGTLMKPIVRAFGTGAQEAHIASRVGDAMTSASITAGAIPDPGSRVSDFIPGGKTTVDASLGSAQVWGGGQTIALGSGLVLTGGAIASTGGLALAGWGGWEIGQGFNQLWKAFSGQLPGEDIYDWFHPDPCK